MASAPPKRRRARPCCRERTEARVACEWLCSAIVFLIAFDLGPNLADPARFTALGPSFLGAGMHGATPNPLIGLPKPEGAPAILSIALKTAATGLVPVFAAPPRLNEPECMFGSGLNRALRKTPLPYAEKGVPLNGKTLGLRSLGFLALSCRIMGIEVIVGEIF